MITHQITDSLYQVVKLESILFMLKYFITIKLQQMQIEKYIYIKMDQMLELDKQEQLVQRVEMEQ